MTRRFLRKADKTPRSYGRSSGLSQKVYFFKKVYTYYNYLPTLSNTRNGICGGLKYLIQSQQILYGFGHLAISMARYSSVSFREYSSELAIMGWRRRGG
jgi:hypothetical protein